MKYEQQAVGDVKTESSWELAWRRMNKNYSWRNFGGNLMGKMMDWRAYINWEGILADWLVNALPV